MIRKPTPIILLVTCLLMVACAPPSLGQNALSQAVGSQQSAFTVDEYPLVEQSSDNPTHPGFAAHLPDEARARRAQWREVPAEDLLSAPNDLLSGFGYHLEMNPNSPFRAYALYLGEELEQNDILHFWPVTLNAAEDDFLLPFETLYGERLVATRTGLRPWPGDHSQKTTPPIYLGDRLAYAAAQGSQLSVQAGGQVLYSAVLSGAPLAAAQPGRLHAWSSHWALEMDGQVILDGEDLNQALDSERVFHWQTIHGEPFFFYTQGGLTRMSYAGHSLPYVYDQIVTGEEAGSAQFAPSGNQHMVWFYALRDGLWYYVEAGVFEE